MTWLLFSLEMKQAKNSFLLTIDSPIALRSGPRVTLLNNQIGPYPLVSQRKSHAIKIHLVL
jgi:hypothetical protein